MRNGLIGALTLTIIQSAQSGRLFPHWSLSMGPPFNLGMFGADTEEIYDEFVQKLREGGLEKYEAEWNRQRDEFLASK